jgi:DNA-binding NtrC family response regulator
MKMVHSDPSGAARAGVPLPLIGASEAAVAARTAFGEASAARGSVLLVGENGCRPADVAKALHRLASPARPFVAIDCASLVAAEIDSRLFGVLPRRATQELEIVGPDAAVVAADGGTLYLEQIDELPASAQRRLARVLRDGEVAIGGRTATAATFRLIGATSKDLEVEANEGRFRTELLRRFTARIALPSLRQRPQDVPTMLERLSHDSGRGGVSITTPAQTILSAMPWPGNLDELASVFARILDATNGTVRQEDVLAHLPIQGTFPRPDLTASLREARRRFERDYISAVLERHHWRMSEAARTLGIERANLYRKTRQLGITRAPRGEAPAVDR